MKGKVNFADVAYHPGLRAFFPPLFEAFQSFQSWRAFSPGLFSHALCTKARRGKKYWCQFLACKSLERSFLLKLWSFIVRKIRTLDITILKRYNLLKRPWKGGKGYAQNDQYLIVKERDPYFIPRKLGSKYTSKISASRMTPRKLARVAHTFCQSFPSSQVPESGLFCSQTINQLRSEAPFLAFAVQLAFFSHSPHVTLASCGLITPRKTESLGKECTMY